MQDTIFSSITVGGLTLKNRIVFAPTTVGEHGLQRYERIAQGGAGLIILPDVSVVPSMLGMPSLDSMKYADYFRSVLDVCHQHGCKVSVQLFHPEYDTAYIGSLYRKRGEISADEVHRKLAENMTGYADGLTLLQIGRIVQLFAQAAKNAQEIGLDMIQLHGDRLAGSFSSALFNHRTDAYGERTRFCVDMVRAVRGAAPHMPLDYKITVRTQEPALGKGGVLLEEVRAFVPALENAGVDSFHVALANHSNIRDTIPARNHPHLQGEGCFLHLAREVKKYTAKPVCAVGKIQTPSFARDVLAQGFALVGLSRQLIADPEWPQKAKQGRDADIRYCTYCNARCVSSIMTGKSVGCVLDGQKVPAASGARVPG